MIEEVLIVFLNFTLVLTPTNGSASVHECADSTVRISHPVYPAQNWPYESVNRYRYGVAFEVDEDAIMASGFEACTVVLQPAFGSDRLAPPT